jgi:hypothetical protein
MHVDAVARAAEGELDAMVDQALAMGARAGADLIQQFDRAFLKQASADSPQHVIRGLPLQNDIVDVAAMK